MTIVRACLGGCGRRIAPPASRCPTCKNAQRRARRHPGYDTPAYRAARKLKVGRLCERCGRATATSVHHLDGDPANNGMRNLLGVCDGCKPIVDAIMRQERDQ